MKRCFLLIISIILSLCFATTVMAESPYPSSFSKEQRDAMKEEIQAFFNSISGLDVLPAQSFDADQAFFIEPCNEYIVETVRKRGSFFSLKCEESLVCVPTNNGEIRLQVTGEKVKVLGYSVSATGKPQGFSWTKLASAIKNYGLKGDPERNRIIRSNLYSAVFAVISLEGKEYVAVFNSMMDEAGIEDEKLYPAEELLAKMDAYYDEEATQKAARIAWLNGGSLGGGGILTRGTPLPQVNFLRLGLIGGAVVLCLALFLVFNRRRKREHRTGK